MEELAIGASANLVHHLQREKKGHTNTDPNDIRRPKKQLKKQIGCERFGGPKGRTVALVWKIHGKKKYIVSARKTPLIFFNLGAMRFEKMKKH